MLALAIPALVGLGLFAALTPALRHEVAAPGLTALSLTAEPSPPPPPPSPAPRPAGAAASAGRRATADSLARPVPKIAFAPVIAPLVASTGAAATSGATEDGVGTGAGGAGQGTGAGGAGTGTGAGTPLAKLSGDINSAKDYPIASRDLRIGDHVIVALTVGPDGKPTACRIHRPSRDPAADAITCRLALQRFRFRPATDAAGRPVTATYGWKQSWHY